MHNNSSLVSLAVKDAVDISSLGKTDFVPEQLPEHRLWLGRGFTAFCRHFTCQPGQLLLCRISCMSQQEG